MDAPQVSTAFPEGEGDLCLISNDGVLFYVHSQLLRHSSPVFATMFEIGGGTGKPEGKSNDPVRMEADAATLELLLLYVYPLHKNPQLETLEQISTLLSLSHRYELNGVTQQLRTALTESPVEDDTVTLPLYKMSPLTALAIADAYELVPEARLALRYCLDLDQSRLLQVTGNINIPVRIMSVVLALRQQRIDWFASKMDSAATFHQWRKEWFQMYHKLPEFAFVRCPIIPREKKWITGGDVVV